MNFINSIFDYFQNGDTRRPEEDSISLPNSRSRRSISCIPGLDVGTELDAELGEELGAKLGEELGAELGVELGS